MSVHTLNLVWKRAGEDIELGTCFQLERPVKGELVTFVCEHGSTWRVQLVYHQPFIEILRGNPRL